MLVKSVHSFTRESLAKTLLNINLANYVCTYLIHKLHNYFERFQRTLQPYTNVIIFISFSWLQIGDVWFWLSVDRCEYFFSFKISTKSHSYCGLYVCEPDSIYFTMRLTRTNNYNKLRGKILKPKRYYYWHCYKDMINWKKLVTNGIFFRIAFFLFWSHTLLRLHNIFP